MVVHLHDLAGGHLPNRWDVMVRMRGWHQAFADLAPVLDEPTVKGLPIMSDQRLLLTQALYEWRDRGIQPYAWNPGRTRQDHYQFKYSFPDKIGQDVILLTDTDEPDAIARRFANVRLMKSTKVMVAPDRAIELHVFLLRGFLGYSQQSYDTQSGTLSTPSQDD